MASKLPTFDRLMNPLLHTLRAPGGSGAIDKVYKKVVEQEKLPDDGGLAQLMSLHVLFSARNAKTRRLQARSNTFAEPWLPRPTRGISSGSVNEALRDGAQPIDLIEGDALAEKLKELGLGITRETIQILSIDDGWVANVQIKSSSSSPSRILMDHFLPWAVPRRVLRVS